jgi:hypothetical protein
MILTTMLLEIEAVRLRVRRDAQFGDGIAPLSLDAHERHADLPEDRINEGVSVPAFGQKMARGDRVESEGVIDHKVDALRHDGVGGRRRRCAFA